MDRDVFSFIIVTWNSANYIKDCLNSIYNINYPKKEVIVIDNGSQDSTIDIVKNEFRDVKLLRFDNPGFGYSCNRGAEISSGRYLFFLNPDTKILKADLYRLSDFFNENEKNAVAGCKLLWEDGRFQDSYKRFFSPLFSVLEVLEFHYYFSNNFLNKKVNYNFKIFRELTEVDWVIGAAFVVKRDYFEKVDGFDESFFMYFEEIDLCKRIREVGGKVYFYPDIEVIHFKGKSSEQTSVRKIEYYQSMAYYHRKHSGFLKEAFVRFSIFFSSILFLFVYIFEFIFEGKKIFKKAKLKFRLIKWSIYL